MWNGAPQSTGRKKSYKKQKKQLLDRDGSDCFYCAKPLGEDITVEHLINLTSGGKNNLANMVLAHDQCNYDAGAKPLNEKVKIAIDARLQHIIGY